MTIPIGTKLPDARLATVGGTSFSTSQLLGRKAVIYGWGSWSDSHKALAALQMLYEKGGFELVTVAFEVTGPGAAMKHLKPAGASHTLLIDATCTLSRRWGIRSVPFTLVLDEKGVVVYSSDKPDAKKIAAALKKKSGRSKPPPKIDRETEKRAFQVEILMQGCTNFLGRKRVDDAKQSLAKALELDPANEIISAQLRAL